MTHRTLKHQDPNQEIYHHTLTDHPDIVVVESSNTRTGEINFHLAQYNAMTDKWYRVPEVTKLVNIPV